MTRHLIDLTSISLSDLTSYAGVITTVVQMLVPVEHASA